MPIFSKPLFLVNDHTDSELIALLSAALVYKIAKACQKVIDEAAEFFWFMKNQWKRLLPPIVLNCFPAFNNDYSSLETLKEHMSDTNATYPFLDNRRVLVSRRIQHLANIGAFFFEPAIRHESPVVNLSEERYFELASTMLRHIVYADYHDGVDEWIGPERFFDFRNERESFYAYNNERREMNDDEYRSCLKNPKIFKKIFN